MREFVEQVINARSEGRSHVSLVQVRDKVREVFDVHVGDTSVRKHAINCMGKSWGRP